MGTTLWVIGLGFLGMVIFGPIGGSIGGALGYVIGGALRSDSSPAPPPNLQPLTIPERSGEKSQKERDALQISAIVKPNWKGRIIVVVAVLAIGVWLYWEPDPVTVSPVATLPERTARPTLVHSTWSTRRCLQDNFGRAMALGMPVPPEVRLFCAYPWNHAFVAEVRSKLEEQGISHERALLEMAQRDPRAKESLTMWQAMQVMSMPDGVMELADVSKSLAMLRALSNSDTRVVAEKLVGPDYSGTLRRAMASVPWDATATVASVRQHDIPESSAHLLTDRGVTLSVDQLEELTRQFSAADYIRAKIEEDAGLRSNPGALVMRDLTESGLHRKHALELGFVIAQINFLHLMSSDIRIDANIPAAWKPSVPSTRRDGQPLEVYWLKEAPAGWCGGNAPTTHAQFCAQEDRVFVPVNLARRSILGAGPEMPHELAHAFLNARVANVAPFIVEGITYASGERAFRSAHAAERVASIPGPPPVVPALQWKMAGTPNGSAYEEFARKAIADSPLTDFQKVAMCNLSREPLSIEPLVRYVSLTNGPFRALSPAERSKAYQYGWAIFHYSLDVARIGSSLDPRLLDASPLQRYSEEVDANLPLSQERRGELERLVSQVQSRIVVDLKRKKVTC